MTKSPYIKLAQIAPEQDCFDSPLKDGKIKVIVDGVTKDAFPCFHSLEFEPISAKCLSLFRDVIGVWVVETESDYLLYLGFFWKGIDLFRPNSIPLRWIEINDPDNPDFSVTYPYLKFKISDSWLFMKSDGGGFNLDAARRGFILIKNTITFSEFSINARGLYFYDRFYETEKEKIEKEVRNKFIISKDSIVISDRRKNLFQMDDFGIQLKDFGENLLELNGIIGFIRLSHVVRSEENEESSGEKNNTFLMTPDGVFLEESSAEENKNFLHFDKEGITIQDRFDSKIEFRKDGIKIQFKDNVFEITQEGLKYNGKFLVSENFIDWMDTNSSTFGLGNMGAPVPIFSSALSQFIQKKLKTIQSEQSFLTTKK